MKTAEELGFKYKVGDILAHVAQILDFGTAAPKRILIGATNGTPCEYPGHAFVVLACRLELCSGGVQRTYACRIGDPGMITHKLENFHEHELIPWADAVATVHARTEAEKKYD